MAVCAIAQPARARVLLRDPGRLLTLLVAGLASAAVAAQEAPLPNRPGSLKFAAIGDNGTGERTQYELANQMVKSHATFPFDLVIMLGDNLLGSQRAADFVKKFELPYAPLLTAGVRFHAALGNHDRPENAAYKLWNMNGERYYSYVRGNVHFFALDSNRMDAKQAAWIETSLREAPEDWKICYFHHPLYSSAGRHGSAVDLRALLEPIFVKHGVNVVFAGHDHVYERLKPQKGIVHFVSGAGGKLRRGSMRPTEQTAAFFDQDRSFMLVEIVESNLHFQVVSRTGKTVDSGIIARQSR